MKINDGKLQYTYSEQHFMSTETDNYFEIPIEFPNHKTPINIEYVRFDKKMIDSLVIDKNSTQLHWRLLLTECNRITLRKVGF